MALHLELESFGYPGRSALFEALSLSLAPGQVVGLVGGSGSGKSTLIGLLAGLHPQPLGGRMVGRRSESGADPERGVGYLASDPATFLTGFCESVAEEVGWSLFGQGWSPERVSRRVVETLEHFSLTPLADRVPTELSGGQAQMVALAAVWARRPRWLLLDEPASRLDPLASAALREAVAALAAEHEVGVVWATSDLGQVASFCDTVWSLDERPLLQTPADQWSAESSLAVPPWPWEWARRGGEAPGSWSSLLAPRAIPTLDPLDRSEETLVEIRDVTYQPPGRDVPLFECFCWSLTRGHCLGLAGPNGAGKTTLARLLRGLLRPGSGDISVAGRPVTPGSVASLASVVAYTFQDPADLFLRSRVDAELAYSAQLLGLPVEEARMRIDAAMQRFALAPFAHWHPRELPASAAALLGVALSWISRAPLQILDEPLARLDRPGRALLEEVLQQWRAEGTTVVLVAHDLDWLCAVCHQVLVLDRGTIVGEDAPERLFLQPEVARLLGQPWAYRGPS